MLEREKVKELNPYQERFATVKETAVFLGVPESWIYERTRKGAIPVIKLGKYVRFDLAAISAWAKTGTK